MWDISITHRDLDQGELVMRKSLAGLAIMIFVILSMDYAFADDPAVTTISFAGIINAIAPYFYEVLSTGAAVVSGWAISWIRTTFKINLDAKMADRLQATILNAAGLLWQRVGPAVIGTKIDVKDPEVAKAVQYVLDSIPDVLKHFAITDPQAIADKIAAKVGQLAAPAPTPISGQ